MFRKKGLQKSKKQIRRRRLDEDEDEDDNQQSIRERKKRRQLLESVQYKRGTNAAKLLSRSVEEEGSTVDVDNARDAEETGTNKNASKKEGILEQKHRKAMEDFIEQNMSLKKNTDTKGAADVSQSAAGDDLYAQLAESARRLAGKESSTDNSALAAAGQEDADVGAGGAMIAGTGLAEVVLPVEERLKNMEDTVRELKQRQKKDTGLKALPTTSSSRIDQNAAFPHRFAAPRATVRMPETERGEPNIPQEGDTGRIGFAAFRQGDTAAGNTSKAAEGQKHSRAQRATDDRAYKHFVSNQRERRQNR